MATTTTLTALFTLVPIIWAGAGMRATLKGRQDTELRMYAAQVIILTCSLSILLECIYRLLT